MATFLSKVREYISRSGSVGEPAKPNEEKVYSEIFGIAADHSNESIKISDVHAIIKKKVTEDMPGLLRWYRELGEDMGVRWLSEEVVIDNSIESDTNNEELEHDTEQTAEAVSNGEEIDAGPTTEETLNVTEPAPIKKQLSIHIDTRNGRANGILNSDLKVTILANSKLNTTSGLSKESKIWAYRNKYSKYIQNGVLTTNISGLSMSNSACIILITSVNGWAAWKDEHGRQLSYLRSIGFFDTWGVSIDDTEATEDAELAEETPEYIDQEIKQEETSMTPEELIAKGLQGMLAQQKQVTVDISDSAIQKLSSLIRTNNDVVEEDDSTPELEKISDTGSDYTLQNRESDIIGIPYDKIQTAVSLGLNIIYRGVPGCGKTYVANCDAKVITGISETNRIKQIDFTENLSYSDTMVGLQQSMKTGTWSYQKGEIARFCEFALHNPNKPFVLILNEFTRANTEAVLGQMFTAMENKYRGKTFTLDSGDAFICPKNLVVLATMNGTDKGVKKLDKATEERFYIIDVQPLWGEWYTSDDSYYNLIDKLEIKVNSTEDQIVKTLCGIMYNINELCDGGGILTADHQIGQRQLLQFLEQTDINGKKIEYNTTVLGIIIDQLIDRTRSLAALNDSIANKLTDLHKLREECK